MTDENAAGKVDAQCFSGLLSSLGVLPSDAGRLFAALDRDRTGQVTLRQWRRFVENAERGTGVASVHASFDPMHVTGIAGPGGAALIPPGPLPDDLAPLPRASAQLDPRRGAEAKPGTPGSLAEALMRRQEKVTALFFFVPTFAAPALSLCTDCPCRTCSR